MKEYLLDFKSLIISLIVYSYISKLTFSLWIKTKNHIIFIFLMLIFGLIYGIIIILLGSFINDNLLLLLNKFRFIFHGLFVPLLILFCGYALNLSGILYYINLFTNVILSLIGFILGIISRLKMVEGTLKKRYTFSEENSSYILIFFVFINISFVVYLVITGIILFTIKGEYFFLLAGDFMFFFAVAGTLIRKPNLHYLFSMYGEVLMIIFLYLFFKNKTPEIIQIKAKIEKNKLN